jgi:uncharacterized protein (DUF697 family)
MEADQIPDNKPVLIKAIEIILAEPENIIKEVNVISDKYYHKYEDGKTKSQIQDIITDHIISNYSYCAAFCGGATALTGVIPGLGTVISAVGGASADTVLCMKWQIEMTMAIAVVYGHDITIEEEKRLCFFIAGLGTISEAAKEGGKALGTKAFIKMTREYLKGATLLAVKEIFRKVGITFTRKAVEKSIPFGVGVIIGFSANKGITYYVGSKAIDFFKEYDVA